MRIVALSDTHGFHDRVQLPDGDILIHAGDFMNGGFDVGEARRFFEWFAAQPHQHKICIAGNHDRLLESMPALASTLVPDTVSYLEDSGIEIGGLKFWGSPVTPAFMGWAFNRERGSDIDRHWHMIPQDTDVLITHGPPLGVLDTVLPGREHLGCLDLLRRVRDIRLKAHVFGHIHGGYGDSTLLGRIVANVAICDEAYQPFRAATVIDL